MSVVWMCVLGVLVALVVFTLAISLLMGLGVQWACVFGCRVFKWHNGDGGRTYSDGVSLHGRCSVCGQEVMMDSQGNWFTCGGSR